MCWYIPLRVRLSTLEKLFAHLNDDFKNIFEKIMIIENCRWISSLKKEGLLPNIILLEEVEECNWKDAESNWILFFRYSDFDICNLTDGGDGVCNPSDETRKKMSENALKRMNDPVWRAKFNTWAKSPERREQISKDQRGKPKSKEHVAKLPQNQPGYVRNLSDETKNKLAESARRINATRVYTPHSDETKDKISKIKMGNPSRTGMKNKQDHNDKISEYQKGRLKSEEHREKIRLASLERWKKHREKKEQENEERIHGNPDSSGEA